MGKTTEAATLYAWAMVELPVIADGAPALGADGRQTYRIFRRGEEIPRELFADYTAGGHVCSSDLAELMAWGAVGETPPGAEPETAGEWFTVVLPDGREARFQGPPPDGDVVIVAGDVAAVQEETTEHEGGAQ